MFSSLEEENDVHGLIKLITPKNCARRLRTNDSEVQAKIMIESERMKTRYNLRITERPFQEGDKTWLYDPVRKIFRSTKLKSNWEGPCTL